MKNKHSYSRELEVDALESPIKAVIMHILQKG